MKKGTEFLNGYERIVEEREDAHGRKTTWVFYVREENRTKFPTAEQAHDGKIHAADMVVRDGEVVKNLLETGE